MGEAHPLCRAMAKRYIESMGVILSEIRELEDPVEKAKRIQTIASQIVSLERSGCITPAEALEALLSLTRALAYVITSQDEKIPLALGEWQDTLTRILYTGRDDGGG